jgi:cytochrome d ubiquinol oxidase subunit I
MAFSGAMIGLAFSMEGDSPSLPRRSSFLALYIRRTTTVPADAVFLCTIPLTVSAAISALFVISANSWMNTPTGFRLVDGNLVDVNPLKAFANPAWAHQAVHGTLAAYVATGFAVAGFYAAALLRGRVSEHNKLALTLALAVGSICLPLMLASGDWAAYSVANHQKAKLAAMEAHFTPMAGAPLIIGGWPDPATGKVLYGIEIPKLLSFLAHRDFNAVVQGLDAFPPGDVPDPRLVHPFFGLMTGSVFIMFAAAVWFWWLRWRRREMPMGKWPLRALLCASPFGMIALESGWLVTEFGRQPWIVQGYMRVSEGATPSAGIGIVFFVFLLLYLALTIALLRLLLRPSPERTEDLHVDH